MINLTGPVEHYREYARTEKKNGKKPTERKKYRIWYAGELQKKILARTVLFYSSNAYALTGAPRVLLERILSEPGFGRYQFVVCLRSREMIEKMRSEGFRDRRIVYMRVGSSFPKAYWSYVARAAYIVADGKAAPFFVPREEQVYIQTSFLYKGIPVGCQKQERYSVEADAVMKSLLMADYIVSPSDFYTEEIINDAYRVEYAGSGRVVTCRFPVLDKLSETGGREALSSTGREYRRTGKKELLVLLSERYSGVGVAKQLVQLAHSEIGGVYEIYFKPAQAGYRKARRWLKKNGAGTGIHLLLNEADTYSWIVRCDAVAADFGEYFFYSLAAGKPTVLLDRFGILCSAGELMKTISGTVPSAHSAGQLARCLEGELAVPGRELVKKIFSSEKSPDEIFEVLRGQRNRGRELDDGREHVLLMAMLGHQTKDTLVAWEKQVSVVMQLMLDEGKDVTLLSDMPESEDRWKKIEMLMPKGVRILYRKRDSVMTEEERNDTGYLIRNMLYTDDILSAVRQIDSRAVQNDFRRCVGNLRIDTLIFAGPASVRFLLYMFSVDAGRKIFWDQRNYAAEFEVADRQMRSRQRFRNLCMIPEMFDNVLHWDGSEMKTLRKNNLIQKEGRHLTVQRLFDLSNLPERRPAKEIMLRGKTYWVTEEKCHEDGQLNVVVLLKQKTWEERKALNITYSACGSSEAVMERLREMHEEHPDWYFYIFDAQDRCAPGLELVRSSCRMQEYTMICSNYFLWNEIQLFSAYYYVEEGGDIYEELCRGCRTEYLPLWKQ